MNNSMERPTEKEQFEKLFEKSIRIRELEESVTAIKVGKGIEHSGVLYKDQTRVGT